MPCYHPLLAWRCADGGITFVERQRYDTVAEVQLPCGHCVGCRLDRSRQWAIRCIHEAKTHKANAFITLTYAEENVPAGGQLVHADFQRFMRRLRKRIAPERVRFYMCGEYMANLGNPHFHACLFGIDFPDRTYWRTGESGAKVYRSATLESLWPQGFSTVGEVNFETAGYVARYCMKKITGHNANIWYGEKKPEYNAMSLKPGIGRKFLEKWKSDIYPNDYVVVNGTKVKPPKYYDKIIEKENNEIYEEIKFKREIEGRLRYEDNTERRLNDKEIVTKARIKNLQRN